MLNIKDVIMCLAWCFEKSSDCFALNKEKIVGAREGLDLYPSQWNFV